MLTTTHIFNKAVLRAKSRTDIGDNLHGLDIDELLTIANREVLAGMDGASELGKVGWSICIGIEIGKLLCDPATYLDND